MIQPLNRHKQSLSIIRRGYKISVVEGIFAQIYGNLAQIGSAFIIKLMVILGASPFHYSLLSALGQISAVWQPLGVALTHRLKQRRMACVLITGAGRFLTLFLGLALLFPSSQQGIWYVLALLFFSAGLQAVGANIWIAWISDLIPLSIRGRFFSRRNQILLACGLVVSYILSFHVDLFENAGSGIRAWYVGLLNAESFFTVANQRWFLASIYVFATLVGLLGLYFLSKQPERDGPIRPAIGLKNRYKEPFKDKNFRLLLIFGMWWMLAIGVGSPFWSPYMMKKLHMGLSQMQVYSTLHIFSSLLSFTFWGRFIDRFGNKSAMTICVILGGLNPMFWLFTSAGNYHILWLEAFVSGFMWAGTGVITTNFVLSIAVKGSEQVYSGIYAAVTGASMMLSTLASGIFYPEKLMIGSLLLEPEQVIFGVGGIMRWLSLIPLAFVVERRGVSLRRAFSDSLLQAVERILDFWQSRIKRG